MKHKLVLHLCLIAVCISNMPSGFAQQSQPMTLDQQNDQAMEKLWQARMERSEGVQFVLKKFGMTSKDDGLSLKRVMECISNIKVPGGSVCGIPVSAFNSLKATNKGSRLSNTETIMCCSILLDEINKIRDKYLIAKQAELDFSKSKKALEELTGTQAVSEVFGQANVPASNTPCVPGITETTQGHNFQNSNR